MAAMSEIDPNTRSRPLLDSEVQVAKMDATPVTPEKRPANIAFSSSDKLQAFTTPRQPSPALSSSSELTSVSVVAQRANDESTSAPPPKRRKLTTEEKEQQRLAKEERGRKRAEEKQKREEEKLKKDEERKVKLEEREEKRREKEIEKQQKEEEKRLKDEEKRLKEEEKQKKEQAQKRINSFFAKPSTPSKPDATALAVAHETSPLLHNVSLQTNETATQHESEPASKQLSDYASYFLPYALPSHSVLAPYNSYTWDEQASTHFDTVLKKAFSSSSDSLDQRSGRLPDILDLLPRDRVRGIVRPSVKRTMDRMETSTNDPVDLTAPEHSSIWTRPLAVLKTIPIKNILFHEDVRPPYRGTYSKINDQRVARRLGRNPHLKSRPDTNYDYDSEAEWEEPEEGEDLNSEGESDAESVDGEEDMDEFLDDEEATDLTLQRRRHVGGDLEPVCSGLCWADGSGRYTNSSENAPDGSAFKLKVLADCFKAPIDPFSDAYWQTATEKPEPASVATGKQSTLMEPPKHPLQLKPNTMVNGARRPGRPRADGSAPKAPKGPVRLLAGEELEEFKKAIEGSDLTKVGLIEVLKKRFPKSSKESIKDTLSTVAARVGARDSDKRWRIIQT